MTNIREKFCNIAGALALAFPAMLPSDGALAQVVTQQPQFVAPHAMLDLGNGPIDILPISGNAGIFTSQGSGTGTASASTALTLTATPAVPPIVGGFITCNVVAASCSIPANTTVAAYNGTTGITLSASSTITAVQVNWGAACPVSTQANIVPPPASTPLALIQAIYPPWGMPMYTQARVCAYGGNGPGMQFATFAIGAH